MKPSELMQSGRAMVGNRSKNGAMHSCRSAACLNKAVEATGYRRLTADVRSGRD